ncbi:hypothetical protein GFJ94_06065 [Flavobacterium sp. LMO8]|uniref:hypothetical protein n=1 Tax=Flavobacterium sp. LMO8 TaxID=2654244 RepID=UPI001291A2E6|nr:hypothetical protein [Flavobacterium sp. LMO8]MQP24625.1 hypothetical protein [Flavobacterium sp. LMO8]
MKKVIFTLIIIFVAQFNFANENDSLLIAARNYSLKHNYTMAIKMYKEYVKVTEVIALKNVYIELANCYFKNEDKDSAVKTIVKAIESYGLTEEDFIYNQNIDAKLSDYALAKVYNDLEKLQKKYLATLE